MKEVLVSGVSRAMLAVPGLRWLFGWGYTQVRKRSAIGPLYAALEAVFGRTNHWVVFDVGANDAGSGIAYARAFPRTEVHLFEAHPAVAEIARRRVIRAGLAHRAHVHEVAASDAVGRATFHVSSQPARSDWRSEVSDSSSLLRPTGHADHFKQVAFASTIEVPTIRLDEGLSTGRWPAPDFIHLDVQGAELMVLDGLGAHLEGVRCIWLEVEEVELYADQPLAHEVSAYLTAAGFECSWSHSGKFHGDQLWIRRAGPST